MTDPGADAQKAQDINRIKESLEAMVKELPSNLVPIEECENEGGKANFSLFLAELCYGRKPTPGELFKLEGGVGEQILDKAYCVKICPNYMSSCQPFEKVEED